MPLHNSPNVWGGMHGGIGPLTTMPFLDRMPMLFSHQHGQCAFFERQYWKCMEAYGQKMGTLHCDLEYRDFQECIYADKQMKRSKAIRTQRMKLFGLGKLDRPFVQNTTADSYWPEYYSNGYKWDDI